MRRGWEWGGRGRSWGRISLRAFGRAAELANFDVDPLDAMIQVSMIGKEFRGSFAAGGGGVEVFEESGHGTRSETGIVEKLRAHDVCLRFRAARIVEEGAAEGELARSGGRRARGASEDSARRTHDSRAQLCELRFGGLVGAVAKCYVGEFVSHDGSELTFGVGGFDHATIDEQETAEERKGVDAFVVNAMKFPRVIDAASVEMRDETLAELAEIGVYFGVVAQGKFLLNFEGGFAAELDVLLGGVKELMPGLRLVRSARAFEERRYASPGAHGIYISRLYGVLGGGGLVCGG